MSENNTGKVGVDLKHLDPDVCVLYQSNLNDMVALRLGNPQLSIHTLARIMNNCAAMICLEMSRDRKKMIAEDV